MPGLARRESGGQASDVSGRLEPASEAPIVAFWPPRLPHWRDARGLVRVEQYRKDGTLVIRAELPGIDPGQEVELTVSHGILHINAVRREEEKREGKSYLRRELRYGPQSRSLPLPEGVTGDGITATYKEGVLEIRVPEPKRAAARKIAISKS